jgi:spore coat protein CotH
MNRFIFPWLFIIAILLSGYPMFGGALTPPPRSATFREASERVFLENEITRVDVTINPSDFQNLLNNPWSDDLKRVTLRWRNSRIDETLEDVGFRVRGNTSRNAARKSWKIDLNTFVPGRQFYGLEKINLNGQNNDPSLLRTAASWRMIRKMGLPGSRTHFAALYINGTFWAIQVHVEQIDEEFAGSWFGNKKGNLYKCLHTGKPADLKPIPGEDYPTYGANGKLTYEEQNNDPLTDYTDLRDFIRFLDQSSDAAILEHLESRIHVDNALRMLAAEVAIGHWDDYWYGSNNYYLYNNEDTQRFEWIPYDLDNTLGIDFFSTDWSSRHFEKWGEGGFGTNRPPLTEALFGQSEWRRQYRRYLRMAAALLKHPETLEQVDRWRNLLLPWFNGTLESGGVVGFSDQGFDANAHILPASYRGGSYHTIGVKPYLVTRAATLEAQLEAFASTPPLPPLFINEALASNTAINTDEHGDYDDWVELYNDGDTEIDLGGMTLTDDVTSPFRWTFPPETRIPSKGFLLIWADGEPEQGPLHATFRVSIEGETLGLFDTMANGRVLIDSLSLPPLISNVSYGRYPDGSDFLTSFTTVTPEKANDITSGNPPGPRPPPRVFINEFMASNGATLADEAGDFDDWIELYNAENVAVDLSGMHLSDHLQNPTRFRFPEGVVINARGFLLVWADEQPHQGPLHATFKLSADGESISLYDTQQNNLQLIHSVVFGPQTRDVSMGLLPDGHAEPVVLDTPSPGRSNQGASITSTGWFCF